VLVSSLPCAVLIDRIRYAQADHFLDAVADADLDVFAFAGHAQVGPADLTEEKERRLRLLPKGETQRVVLAALPYSLLDVGGQAVEAVPRARTVDALVGPLVIVVVDPVLKTLDRISEGGEDRLL
jgi:hypothetical protein